jgi:hypothetical protein
MNYRDPELEMPSTALVKDPRLIQTTILFWYLLNHLGDGNIEEGYLKFADLCLNPSADGKDRVYKIVEATRPAMHAYSQDFGEDPEYAGAELWNVLGQARDMGQASFLSYYTRAAWYDSGMPTVEIGHKLAAAFMVTQASKAVIEEVQPPHKTFLVEVPDKLILVKDSFRDELVEVRCMLLSRLLTAPDVYCWLYYAFTTGTVHVWRYGADLNLFVKEDAVPTVPRGPLDMDLEDIDERAAVMLGRLMVNTCMYMTNHQDEVRKIGKGHQAYRGQGRRRDSPTPVRRVFQLRPDVRHDFRESVRNFVAGVSRKMTVQKEVSGHWKHVVYGAGRALRKREFVQPYWRGPDDAPIALAKNKIEVKE